MGKVCPINELRYQANNLLWGSRGFLKVRTGSGILKNLVHDEPSQSPAYPGKAERGGFFLKLEPLGVHIGEESESPEAKTYQRQSYESGHSQEAGTLIIREAKVLFDISDTQFQGEPERIDMDDLAGREGQIGREQDDGLFFGLDHHYPHLLGGNIFDPQICGNNMHSLRFAVDSYRDLLEGEEVEQLSYFPFLAFFGFGGFSASFLLARWQRRFWLWVVPTDCIPAHASDHMNAQREHPIDEGSLGKVSVCYYSKRRSPKHLIKPSYERTDRIPEGHSLSHPLWAYHKPKGIALARNKVGQQGPAQGPCQRTGTEQTSYGPVMSNEMLAPVWVSTVVVPFLYSNHFPLDLGDQRGIDPAQTSSIDQETVCHLFPDQRQDFALDLVHIPLVLGQKSLPTGDVPVYKKADSGYIGHTFTALSKEHEGQREALKVSKIVCTKNWSESPI